MTRPMNMFVFGIVFSFTPFLLAGTYDASDDDVTVEVSALVVADHDGVEDIDSDSDSDSDTLTGISQGITSTFAQSLVVEEGTGPVAKVRCEPLASTGIYFTGSVGADSQTIQPDCYVNGGNATSKAIVNSHLAEAKGHYVATADDTTTATVSFQFSNVDTNAYLQADLECEVSSGTTSEIHYVIDVTYTGSGVVTKKVSDDGGSTWTTLLDTRTSYNDDDDFDTHEDEWDIVESKSSVSSTAFVDAPYPTNEDAGGGFQAFTVVQ